MRIYCCTIRGLLGPSIPAARVSIYLARWMQTLCAFRAQSGSNPRLNPSCEWGLTARSRQVARLAALDAYLHGEGAATARGRGRRRRPDRPGEHPPQR